MITQSMIAELRSKTGAGIINCRDTLKETNGDLEKAVAILKEKGLTIAAKKVERVTAEGLVAACLAENSQAGAIVEVNCETDFVAINQEFATLADNLARQAVNTTALTITDLMAEKYIADANMTVNEALTSLIAKLRENITFRRFAAFTAQNGIIQSYLHNGGRIGVLVELSCPVEEPAVFGIAKEIAMQIAAAKPLFVTRNDIDPAFLAHESETYKRQAIADGKPESIAVKIATGKIAKYIKEKCLMEQAWIKDENQTVSEYLREESEKLGAVIGVARFARFEKGEGLAKREDDIAKAVREQIFGN